MNIWHLLLKMWRHQNHATKSRQNTPQFESLESRLLLSSDPLLLGPAEPLADTEPGDTVLEMDVNPAASTTPMELNDPSTGAIEGYKWHDLNADGIWDVGESGLADWLIFLDINDNGLLDAGEPNTLTDTNGHYSFAGLNPEPYSVSEVIPIGWEQSHPYQDRLFATDVSTHDIVELDPISLVEINRFAAPTDVAPFNVGLAYDGTHLFYLSDTAAADNLLFKLNPDTGIITDIDPLPAGSYSGLAVLNGRIYALDYAASDIVEFDLLTDTVTNILDIDGINFGISPQYGLAGISGPNALITTTSDGLGGYVLSEINPVTGIISPIPGTHPTAYSEGVAVVDGRIYATDGSDLEVWSRDGTLLSTISPPITSIRALGGDEVLTQRVNVLAGEVILGVNFGNFTISGGIEGSKWHDLNANGLWDTGEPGLAGWTIFLDANSNGQLDAGETNTVTDANGSYAFNNLQPGTYEVAEFQQPGWQQTYP
ncbi:SdrD B-like domain-containing protein, partial [Planctomycetota bacterium]